MNSIEQMLIEAMTRTAQQLKNVSGETGQTQTPNSGGQTPTSSGQAPNSGGQTPNSGSQTPTSSGQAPNSGGQTPTSSGQAPNSGGQTPTSSGQAPGGNAIETGDVDSNNGGSSTRGNKDSAGPKIGSNQTSNQDENRELDTAILLTNFTALLDSFNIDTTEIKGLVDTLVEATGRTRAISGAVDNTRGELHPLTRQYAEEIYPFREIETDGDQLSSDIKRFLEMLYDATNQIVNKDVELSTDPTGSTGDSSTDPSLDPSSTGPSGSSSGPSGSSSTSTGTPSTPGIGTGVSEDGGGYGMSYYFPNDQSSPSSPNSSSRSGSSYGSDSYSGGGYQGGGYQGGGYQDGGYQFDYSYQIPESGQSGYVDYGSYNDSTYNPYSFDQSGLLSTNQSSNFGMLSSSIASIGSSLGTLGTLGVVGIGGSIGNLGSNELDVTERRNNDELSFNDDLDVLNKKRKNEKYYDGLGGKNQNSVGILGVGNTLGTAGVGGIEENGSNFVASTNTLNENGKGIASEVAKKALVGTSILAVLSKNSPSLLNKAAPAAVPKSFNHGVSKKSALAGAGLTLGAAGLSGGTYLALKGGFYIFTPEDWMNTDEDIRKEIVNDFETASMEQNEIESLKTNTYKIKTTELNEHASKIELIYDSYPEIEDELREIYHFNLFTEEGYIDNYLLFLIMCIDGCDEGTKFNIYNTLNQYLEGRDLNFIYTGININEYILDADIIANQEKQDAEQIDESELGFEYDEEYFNEAYES